MFRMSHYTEHLSPSVFEQGPIYPWYSSTYLNSTTPLKCGLGGLWEMTGEPGEAGGNTFLHVKSDHDLTAGLLVAWALPTTLTVENPLTAATTTQAINTTGTLVAGAEVGNLLYFTPNGGTPTIRRILANTTTQITFSTRDWQIPFVVADADAASAQPAAGASVQIIRPFVVTECGATSVPCGVSLGTVTANNYTVVQVAGLGLVYGVGNTTALAAGQPAVPGATGTVTGTPVETGSTDLVKTLYANGAHILPLIAYSGTGALVPAYINFYGAV